MHINNNKQLEVLYFEETFGLGGIETFIVNVLRNINLEKYKITIVTISKTTSQFDTELEHLGVEIIELVDSKIYNPLLRYPKGLKAFSNFLDSNKYRIIHFHVSHALDCMFVELAKLKGIPYRIAHCHNSEVNQLYKRIGHEIFKVLLKKAPTHRYACSEAAYLWLFSNIKTDTISDCVLKNGVAVKRFNFDQEKRNIVRSKLGMNDKFILLHIGRFNLQKNHRFLINLFGEYKKSDTDACLVLVGEGELVDDTKKLVAELGIEASVLFYGTTEKVEELLMASDVFVLPSIYEGLPVTGIEAQAAGISCIFSKTITRELKICPNISFCSINSTKEWIEELFKAKKESEHIQSKGYLEAAGYNVLATVGKIEELYDGLERNLV